MYSHILVPTDGSALSAETCSKAVRLAKKVDARITFFHHVEDPSKSLLGDSALLYSINPERYAEKYEWRQHAVLWKAEAESLALGVECDSVVSEGGSVTESILEAATGLACDLIFMASHGRSSHLRMVLGSVTLKVLVNSPIPVLVSESGKEPPSTMSRALGVIRDEHRSLAAVLRGLRFMFMQADQDREMPDFVVVRGILSYLKGFSSELHHPKEEDYLFRKLSERSRQFDTQIEVLCRQHVQEPKLIDDLETAVRSLESGGASHLGVASQALDRLASQVGEHMALEESLLMPAACELLDEEDWQTLENAFLQNGDPRFGTDSEADARMLFARIVSQFPRPRKLSKAITQ